MNTSDSSDMTCQPWHESSQGFVKSTADTLMAASSFPTGLSGENVGSPPFSQSHRALHSTAKNITFTRRSHLLHAMRSFQDINAVEVPVDSPYLIAGRVRSMCESHCETSPWTQWCLVLNLQATEPVMSKACICLPGWTRLGFTATRLLRTEAWLSSTDTARFLSGAVPRCQGTASRDKLPKLQTLLGQAGHGGTSESRSMQINTVSSEANTHNSPPWQTLHDCRGGKQPYGLECWPKSWDGAPLPCTQAGPNRSDRRVSRRLLLCGTERITCFAHSVPSPAITYSLTVRTRVAAG